MFSKKAKADQWGEMDYTCWLAILYREIRHKEPDTVYFFKIRIRFNNKYPSFIKQGVFECVSLWVLYKTALGVY